MTQRRLESRQNSGAHDLAEALAGTGRLTTITQITGNTASKPRPSHIRCGAPVNRRSRASGFGGAMDRTGIQIVQPCGDTKCIDGHTYIERSE